MKPINVIALLFALALLDEAPGEGAGTHRHRCPCGNEWEHANTCAGDEKAHTCSECGSQVWSRVWE